MGLVRLDTLDPRGWAAPAVTIGNFDGVHRGHRELVGAAVRDARESGGTGVALTFDPHPGRILSPDRAPQALTTLAQKAALLEGLGIDQVAVLPFTADLARLDADAFVRRVLVGALGARLVVVGANFRFGRGRAGTARTLVHTGRELGFRVHAVDPVFHEGAPISSTRIREAVARGAVAAAADLLGRPYELSGRIGRGEQRGRTLGFPTANLETENEILPGRGVYAARAELPAHAPGVPRPAVVNVGHRPTFGGGRLLVEAHLLDFQAELYGEPIRIWFVERLRSERAFAGPQALREQIARDVEAARHALEKA